MKSLKSSKFLTMPYTNLSGALSNVEYEGKHPRRRIISWTIGFPNYVSVLGTHPYQCASWRCCERLRSASVNFFWRFFHHVCPFHNGGFTSAPAHTALSVQQFLTKNDMTPMAHPPYSPKLSLSNFFVCFPGWKNVFKGKHFAVVEEMNKKWQKH